MADLYLASASPRRRELLDSVNLSYQLLVTSIDETKLVDETPKNYVARMAQEKAQAASEMLQKQDLQALPILAADTIVVKDNQVFGKPENQQQAFDMWQQLSNSEHHVMTAVSLINSDRLTNCLSVTCVEFIALSESQMQQYWLTGEPIDKAGAYAIQGLASAWVKQLKGSYSGVVGLPLREVNELLKQAKLNWL